MRRIENQLLPITAAAMAGNRARAIEDAHLGIGCRQSQRTAHSFGRNRVVVAIEAYIDGLTATHRDHAIGVERVPRQLEQARPLLFEGLRTVRLLSSGHRR